MPEVRVAARAEDLGTRHEPAAIVLLGDRLLGDRLPVARPAGAGVELRLGPEQGLPAADAFVRSGIFRIPVLAGESALGAVLARHLVLLRRELRLPLRIRLHDLVHVRLVILVILVIADAVPAAMVRDPILSRLSSPHLA